MNKKKILSLLLVLVLTCSLVFGLTACGNQEQGTIPNGDDKIEEVVVIDYATFYFQSDKDVVPTTQIIQKEDLTTDVTVYDILTKKDVKYNFNADFSESSYGPILNAIRARGLNPTKVQYISIYTSEKPTEINEYTEVVELNNITFYSAAVGVSGLKVKPNTSYLFRVVDNTYTLDASNIVKLDKNLAVNPAEPWNSSITTPAVTEEFLYLIRQNELLKIKNDQSGEIVDKVTLNGSTYYGMSAPIIADNKVICPVGEHVQAFNLDLTEAWDYSNISGFIKSNLVFDNASNNIYVGFFDDYGKTSKFVCLNATTGEKVWDREIYNGYDFGGAVVVKDNIIVKNTTANNENSIVALNKLTGAEVASKDVKGIVESQMVYDENTKSIYFTISTRDVNNIGIRTASYVNAIKFENGTFGEVKEYKTIYNRSVGTPLVTEDKIYVTSNNSDFTNPQGSLEVLDIKSMQLKYEVDTGAACEGSMASKVVSNNGREETFVFFTLNNAEGGLYYIVDTATTTSNTVKTLYASQNKNYTMSSVVVDNNGIMYYKNDSASIFKINLAI